ncbi:MAG: Spy/CpxP family protein refolding chaperone [Candidatus Aegiribacteria sp.]|nr:Spy/CpxP family protein refolding chaperone [Candidatus Aegiribacteria sp.]
MSGKIKIIGITALSIIIVAGSAMAQPPGGWSPPAGGPGAGAHEMGPGQQGGFGLESLAQFRMMFRHIDLTAEQIGQIELIKEAAREEAMAIMEEAGRPEDHISFMEVFTSPTLTVSDLEETMGKMEGVREAIRDVIFEAMVDIHDILTTEQLEKLADMVEEHAGGMGHPMR